MSEAAETEVPQRSFQRAYAASASLTGALISLPFIASFADRSRGHLANGGIPVFIVSMILVPYLLKGGFSANFRAARIVSAIMLLVTGLALGALCFDFSKTHGEGPNGEGAPGAFIIAMALFAAVFFCPWLLTTLRAISARKAGTRIRS